MTEFFISKPAYGQVSRHLYITAQSLSLSWAGERERDNYQCNVGFLQDINNFLMKQVVTVNVEKWSLFICCCLGKYSKPCYLSSDNANLTWYLW